MYATFAHDAVATAITLCTSRSVIIFHRNGFKIPVLEYVDTRRFEYSNIAARFESRERVRQRSAKVIRVSSVIARSFSP